MTIKEYLTLSKLSGSDFAKKVGCGAVWLSFVSNGRRRPSLTMIEKIVLASGGKITVDGILQPFRSEAA